MKRFFKERFKDVNDHKPVLDITFMKISMKDIEKLEQELTNERIKREFGRVMETKVQDPMDSILTPL